MDVPEDEAAQFAEGHGDDVSIAAEDHQDRVHH